MLLGGFFYYSIYIVHRVSTCSNFSKYFLAAAMFTCVAAEAERKVSEPDIKHKKTKNLLIPVSDMMSNTLVFLVSVSKKAVKLLPLISICFE